MKILFALLSFIFVLSSGCSSRLLKEKDRTIKALISHTFTQQQIELLDSCISRIDYYFCSDCESLDMRDSIVKIFNSMYDDDFTFSNFQNDMKVARHFAIDSTFDFYSIDHGKKRVKIYPEEYRDATFLGINQNSELLRFFESYFLVVSDSLLVSCSNDPGGLNCFLNIKLHSESFDYSDKYVRLFIQLILLKELQHLNS